MHRVSASKRSGRRLLHLGRLQLGQGLGLGLALEPCPDGPLPLLELSRQRIKAVLCNGNVKANDAGVRQALIDRLGPPGSKKAPGPTYGVTSHAWAALAVAVAAAHEISARVAEAA